MPQMETCSSGCCSPPQNSVPVLPEPERQDIPVSRSACGNGCCGGAPENEHGADEVSTLTGEPCCSSGDSCCQSNLPELAQPNQQVEPELADSCCGSAQPVSCCDPKQTPVCCSTGDECLVEKTTSGPNTRPDSCCEADETGSASCERDISETGCRKCDELSKRREKPCCDESCLVRIAARECDDSSSSLDGKPCDRHMDAAKGRFGHILESLGCICRALAALNLESCCAPVTNTTSDKSPSHVRGARSRIKGEDTCGESCQTSCCDPKPRQIKMLVAEKSSCPSEVCCDQRLVDEKVRDVARLDQVDGRGREADVEKGPASLERVALSIQGMTCTGCETKLSRTLAAMRGVSNIQASLVLSRAEFHANTTVISVEDAMAQLRKATGFVCERLSNNGYEIDILSSVPQEPLPTGITEARAIDANTLRVVYDARAIGARDIVTSAFGRRLELAPPRPDPTLHAGSVHVRKVGWTTVFSAILTIPVLVLAWAPLPEHDIPYGSISLGLATVIQAAIAGPFYVAALKSLFFARVIEMDLLIVLSTSAAYIFSVVAFAMLVQGRPLSTGEFFETSTLLVTLIMLGRYVSALARQKAVESITIRSLQQNSALLVGADGSTENIDARLLQFGDVFRVLPDSRVVTDGTVVSGSSELDESMMTGEATPIDKQVGSPVVAGSVNSWGALDIRLTRLPGDNTISTIANMVDEAKLSKPKIQDVADRVAGYFVPVVCLLTLVTFVSWVAVGMVKHGLAGSEAAVQAVTYAIAVLIISCPCAIGLAVPMVIVIAGGVAADKGVVFKTAETVEIAHKTTHVVLDKTGTLTRGKPSVVKEAVFGPSSGELYSHILSLVSGNKHPVSVAMTCYLEARGVQPSSIRDAKTFAGKGISGVTQTGEIIKAGNMRWLEIELRDLPEGQQTEVGLTSFHVAIDGVLRATFLLNDEVRPEAREVVAKLQQMGIALSIVSGDGDVVVKVVASQLGIPAERAKSGCSPEDKKIHIQNLLQDSAPNPLGRYASRLWKRAPSKPVVIFIGDGTNDAPALAASTIGIHMSSSSDASIDSAIARSAADAVILRPDLRGLLVFLSLSKAAMRRVAFNFIWSAVYNVFAILLAAGAFVSLGGGGLQARIPPAFAGLGEIVSVVPVIIVAVLLRWVRLT